MIGDVLYSRLGGRVLLYPLGLRRVATVRIQHSAGHLVCAQLLGPTEEVGLPPLELVKGLGEVHAKPQGEIIFFDFLAELRQFQGHPARDANDLPVVLFFHSRHRQTDKIYSHMVAQEPQIVVVQQHTGGLHLDPLERIPHHLHKQPKIGEELPVLLRLRIASEHDCIAAIMPGKFQALEIVLQVKIKKGEVVIHLVLVAITVHLGHTERAVVNAALVGHNDTERLNIHSLTPVPGLSRIS